MVMGAAMSRHRSRVGVDRGRIRWCRRRGRQQAERIHVPVGVARRAHAEVDVRLRRVADGRHDVALGHRASAYRRIRAEMLERGGIPVGRSDRDRPTAGRDSAGEADGSGDRRAHRCACGRADVDAAVLAAGIGVVTKDERSKHRPVDGPGPGERGLHADLERDEDRKQQGEAFHRRSSSLSKLRTTTA